MSPGSRRPPDTNLRLSRGLPHMGIGKSTTVFARGAPSATFVREHIAQDQAGVLLGQFEDLLI
jgi:hypothetical protein